MKSSCFFMSPAAPDTTAGAQLHPEALLGEAKVPGRSWGLPATLRPHQQPAEKDPSWGGENGGGKGWAGRGAERRRTHRRKWEEEAIVPWQEESEDSGNRMLFSGSVGSGEAAVLPPALLLPCIWMSVQSGTEFQEPPGPSLRPGRQRLTLAFLSQSTKQVISRWSVAVADGVSTGAAVCV